MHFHIDRVKESVARDITCYQLIMYVTITKTIG
jgi:hypothetical protein